MAELIVESISNNPTLEGLASVIPDIVYSHAGGKEIKLTLIVPQASRNAENPQKYPCIVFVQGSAWTFPDITYELPQMSEFARNGFIVAMVTHRSALDGFAAPAFLKDVKTAIRFLRANAETYKIDSDRIGIWGTSSGGNTALLVGLTGDDPLTVPMNLPDFPTVSKRLLTALDRQTFPCCLKRCGTCRSEYRRPCAAAWSAGRRPGRTAGTDADDQPDGHGGQRKRVPAVFADSWRQGPARPLLSE